MDFRKGIAKDLAVTLGDKLSFEEIFDLIEVPRTSTHGDYAFPVFPLAKVYKKNPALIAEELAEEIEDSNYEKVVATGPYVNFFLDKTQVSDYVLKTIIKEKNHYGDSNEGVGKNIPIDLSSPNIAKPMSMGHLRSTVIGYSISKIVEKLGYHPIKINHIGDWGTQFGKLIVAYKKWGNEKDIHEDPIQALLELYVRFHEEVEEHPELEDEGREWFRKLESNDEEARRLWSWFREESLLEFQRIYNILDIEFDSYNGEAFYNDKMDRVIDLLEEKNLLINDDNADIVNLDQYDLPPALIRKSDGATLYITRDIAAALYRIENYNFYESLYVVGNEQAMHFKQLKAILKEMGYDWSDDMHHIPFGLISFGGEKLSTRKGNVILLEDVLNKAIEATKEQIENKNPDLENKDQVAHDIGVGAVVFHDLKNERLNSIEFNLDDIIQSEGETGPYVQYTRSRCESILTRSSWDSEENTGPYSLNDEDSWEVIKDLSAFPSKIKEAYTRFEPSVIAKYLLNLARDFNRYYSQHRILEDNAEQEARLALVYATSVVIKEGLRLLGIKAPDQI